MSTTTNIIERQRGLFHNANANSNEVADSTETLADFYMTVKLPTGSDGNAAAAAANDSVTLTTPINAKLTTAYFCPTVDITNEAANTITLTVKTNGVTAISFDSDDLSATAAANTPSALTVTQSNSFVNAGNAILIAYTQQQVAENYLEGELVLGFDRT